MQGSGFIFKAMNLNHRQRKVLSGFCVDMAKALFVAVSLNQILLPEATNFQKFWYTISVGILASALLFLAISFQERSST